MNDALMILLICGTLGGLMVGGVYWHEATHIHVDKYVDATIVGITVVKTGGSSWSTAGESRCIMEDEDGERIISTSVCLFIVGDDIRIHYHDSMKHEISMELRKK